MEAGTPGDGDRRHEEKRKRRGGRGGGRGGGGRRAAAPAGPLKTLAAHSGFGNAARMKRAFERELGIAPRDYRILHAPSPDHSPRRRARPSGARQIGAHARKRSEERT
jgi:AraC-like DNA-binding protein